MGVDIRKVDGRWMVNGKRLEQLNEQEKELINEFFAMMKEQELISKQKKQ